LIEPVITAWKDRHRSVSGHQGVYTMREIVNAILYQGRTGCQWASLPHDLPQKSATSRSGAGRGRGGPRPPGAPGTRSSGWAEGTGRGSPGRPASTRGGYFFREGVPCLPSRRRVAARMPSASDRASARTVGGPLGRPRSARSPGGVPATRSVGRRPLAAPPGQVVGGSRTPAVTPGPGRAHACARGSFYLRRCLAHLPAPVIPPGEGPSPLRGQIPGLESSLVGQMPHRWSTSEDRSRQRPPFLEVHP